MKLTLRELKEAILRETLDPGQKAIWDAANDAYRKLSEAGERNDFANRMNLWFKQLERDPDAFERMAQNSESVINALSKAVNEAYGPAQELHDAKVKASRAQNEFSKKLNDIIKGSE